MKIEDFKKLEKKITSHNFNKSYKNINTIMTVLSYFGHIASISLAFFLLYTVMTNVMDSKVIAGGVSILLLSLVELVKRDLFDKFSIQYLRFKSLTKEVMPLFILSFLIISISFYASIQGAAEFSSKSQKIENDSKLMVKNYTDSINKIVIIEKDSIKGLISNIDNEIKNNKSTLLESLSNKKAKNKNSFIMNDLPQLKSDKNNLIAELDSLDIKASRKIEQYSKDITSETYKKKNSNEKNSLMFIIISVLVELTILAGVYFNEYYKYRSYSEFKDMMEKDPNYQKYLLYEVIFNILFTDETKMNQKLPASKNIIDMCKANNVIILPKDLIEFLKVMANLGIVKVSGSAKYINKTKDVSFELLKKYFNID